MGTEISQRSATTRADLRKKFQEWFHTFILFHLGSDATVKRNEEAFLLRLSIEHTRVEPFTVEIGDVELKLFEDDLRGLEQLLLDQLNDHRRP